MRLFKKLITVIIALLLIFFFGGYILPKSYTIEESIVINKPDSLIFDNVADFNAFALWNPWSLQDTAAETKAINRPGYTGSTFSWKGKKIGEGNLKITRVIVNTHITETLTFVKPWASEAENNFHFEPVNGETKVTWSMTGNNKTPLHRWMMFFFKKSIQRDYQKGLLRLKEFCEKE